MQCYSLSGRCVNVAELGRHKALVAGVVLSIAAHGIVAISLHRGAAKRQDDNADKPPLSVDIEVAPPPPEADDPEKSRLAATKPDEDKEPTAVATVAPKPKPAPTVEPKPKPEPIAVADAGVLDAGVQDAAPPVVASTDAGVPIAQARDAGPGGDGGAAVASTDDGGVPRDGGPAVAVAGDGGIARDGGTDVAVTDPAGGNRTAKSSRTSANLLGYAPGGAKVALLLRFDRLRGTEWAKRTEAIFKPMPDYRALMGGRTTPWSTLFDSMVVSSPKPKDPRRTTVATRSSRSAASMRRFLNGAGTTIRWSSSLGGALGRRSPSRYVPRADTRVFLMPFPGWTVLTPVRTLGVAVQPSPAPLGAWASNAPTWLRRLRFIEAESGQKKGPALMVTVTRFRRKLEVPGLLSLNTPKRATLTMELVPKGFIVRGTLVFANEAEAKAFYTQGLATRDKVVKNFAIRLLLKRIKALNALKGLSLKRKGKLVSYATSLSVADARRVFEFAASFTRQMFGP